MRLIVAKPTASKELQMNIHNNARITPGSRDSKSTGLQLGQPGSAYDPESIAGGARPL